MIKTRGVNLFELMVILAVTAVLVVIALPYFTDSINRQRLVGAAESLYSALQNARSEAVKRNVTVYVSFQTGSSWCYGMNTGSACNCSTPSSCNLGSAAAPNTLLTLSATGLSGSPSQFQFESTRGGASSSNTITFTLSNGSALNVKTRTLGTTSLCSTQISGYPTSCP